MPPQVSVFLTWVNGMSTTWDVFIFIFFAVGALLYGLSLGRDRVVVILLGIYTALAVSTNAPVITLLGTVFHIRDTYLLRIGFFLGTFILVFFLFLRNSVLRSLAGSRTPGTWWQTALFSVFQVGLLISVTLHFLPWEMTQGLTQLTKEVFMSDQGRSVWVLSPIILMILAPKSRDFEGF